MTLTAELGSAAGPLEFAVAITGRTDRMRIYGDDHGNDTTEVAWDGRTLPTVGFAVYVHDSAGRLRTLGLDLDGSRGDPESDARAIAAAMREVGVRFVVCASGGPACRHVFATFAPPLDEPLVADLAARLGGVARSLDTGLLLNTTTGAIRPPLARHRLGGASRILEPADPCVALAALRVGNAPEAAVRLLTLLPSPKRGHVRLSGGLTLLQRPLTARTERLLRDGDMAGRYASRSEAEFAIVLGMIDAGWPPERIQAVAADSANRGFAKFQGKMQESRSAADAYLAHTITSALLVASAHTPTSQGIAVEVHAFVEAALAWHPGGRTAAVDRAVLFAHARACFFARSMLHALSVRQCAEWAGVSHHRTVLRARARLIRYGWLTRRGQGARLGVAAAFAASVPTNTANGGGEKGKHSLPHRGREGMLPVLLTPDLFRQGALGLAAGEVHAYLTASGREITVTALAEGLAHDRKTVRRHLATLARLRLAVRTPAGWLASARLPEHALNELPAESRTLAARQRARHAAERERWSVRLQVSGPALPPSESARLHVGEHA